MRRLSHGGPAKASRARRHGRGTGNRPHLPVDARPPATPPCDVTNASGTSTGLMLLRAAAHRTRPPEFRPSAGCRTTPIPHRSGATAPFRPGTVVRPTRQASTWAARRSKGPGIARRGGGRPGRDRPHARCPTVQGPMGTGSAAILLDNLKASEAVSASEEEVDTPHTHRAPRAPPGQRHGFGLRRADAGHRAGIQRRRGPLWIPRRAGRPEG